MTLHGQNTIGTKLSGNGSRRFRAVNPATRQELETEFFEATEAEVNEALVAAAAAFPDCRGKPPEQIASLLEQIGAEILALGDELIQRAHAETALPEARLLGERTRTINQLRMFAQLVREGSWVDARIDRAIPDRKPLAKPDIRRMLVPIGPVIVFGASNFPLAISVAGGDTASALAAGNPVVAKAHPAHPGTSELTATAVRRAIEKTGMPPGMFSMLHGTTPDVGLWLARHPHSRAIGFTGSLKAGRALFDAAASRPVPIPCHAEMGSINPVFVLPGALRERGAEIAAGLMQSLTLGAGQFCTNPGLVIGLSNGLPALIEQTSKLAVKSAPATMLHAGICENYWRGVERMGGVSGVNKASQISRPDGNQAAAVIFETESKTFLAEKTLHDEVFGPATLFVKCESADEFAAVLQNLEGQLTISIHGTDEDLREFSPFFALAADRAGRLIVNGFPTGLEVCSSMHHGGPYPATTDSRSTSVGTAAILRFARPLCYQDFPQQHLPRELRNRNERQIWRSIDNEWTRADV